MNTIILFLKSEKFIFAALLCVLLGQVVNFAFVFSQANPALLSQFRPELAWVYAILCACGLEMAILISILEGNRWVAAGFAGGFLTINLCWNYQIFEQPLPLAIAKAMIYAMLSISVWFFSDIIGKRISDEKLIRKIKSETTPKARPVPTARPVDQPGPAVLLADQEAIACPDCGKAVKNQHALNAHKQFCKAQKAA